MRQRTHSVIEHAIGWRPQLRPRVARNTQRPVIVEDVADEGTTQQLRDALGLIESVAADRLLLEGLTEEERVRFVNASGDVFCPDVEERRQRTKTRRRRAKADKVKRDEAVLDQTGIRSLRAKPVFLTPNVYPPEEPGVGELSTGIVDDQSNGQLDQLGAQFASPDSADGHVALDEQESRDGQSPQLEHSGPRVQRHCYVCKSHYDQVHEFYDQLCPDCATFNYAKRTETADLGGRVALLTGGRVKIGYQAGIKLLRAGASLIVTTRFPRDAARRYAAEADFDTWGDRLEIYGLDLRHTPSVEALCHHLATSRGRLDFIVNNACQTVRRPPDFYRHMMEAETASLTTLPAHVRALLGGVDGLRGPELVGESTAADKLVETAALVAARAARDSNLTPGTSAAEMSQAILLPEDQPRSALFPSGHLDQDLQQVDLRDRNSWRLTLSEVSTVEFLETQLVNAVAPFVLNARLKPLLCATPERDKHIVNVSAVEGQFYRRLKTTRHPHTNMAKAALNMMTRTSAAEYHGDGIHMNSVDTGWVSDEDPVEIAQRKTAEHGFHPPLDIVDGAARIVDPIISGFNTGTHTWGQFLKDYRPTDW